MKSMMMFNILNAATWGDMAKEKEKSFFDFEFITWSQLGHVTPAVRKMIHDFFVDNEFGFWCPNHSLNQLNISFYLNHTTNPNCYHNESGEIFTIKDIGIGQELTLNYADFEEDEPNTTITA